MKHLMLKGVSLLTACALLVGCGDNTTDNSQSTSSAKPLSDISQILSGDDTDTSTYPDTADTDDTTEVVPVASTDDYSDIFAHELKTYGDNGPANIVISGCEFTIDTSSFCQYIEDVGPAIFTGQQLQYRIKVQEKSYEEVKAGDMTEKAVAAGAVITAGPSVVNVGDVEYIYFSYDLEGDHGVAYSIAGPDRNRALGFQIIVTDSSVADKDAIESTLPVALSARLTDKPDSTATDIENLYGNNYVTGVGAYLDSSSMTYEGYTYSFDVPANYRQTLDEVNDISAMQLYSSSDTSLTITLSTTSTQDAHSYLKNMLAYATQAGKKSADNIRAKDTSNGTIVYVTYYESEYDLYFVHAAMTVKDGYIFYAEGESSTRNLNLDDIIDFFEGHEEAVEVTTVGPHTEVKHDQLYQGTVSDTATARALITQYGEMQRERYDNPEVVEIEKSLQSKYDICAVNLGEMDIETAKDIERGVSYMFDTYPILKGSLHTISVGNMKNRDNTFIALTQTVDFIIVEDGTENPRVVRNEIVLNANKWLSRTNMLNMCKENVESGYWFKNANDPSKVIVHELGHQLLNVLRAKEYGFMETINGYTVYMPCVLTEQNKEAYIDYYWSGTIMNQTVEKQIIQDAYEAWKKAGHTGSEEDFRGSISEYAKGIKGDGGVSYHETFAEAVADIYVNGDDASEASKLILAQINQ